MDVWSWICSLPNSDASSAPNSPFVYDLASSKSPTKDATTQSIEFLAHKTSAPGMDDVVSVTFSVCARGFRSYDDDQPKTLWVSDACPISSSGDKSSFIPLVSQLVEETISRSPTAQDSTIPRSHLHELMPGPISRAMDSSSQDSFPSFFSLLFHTRLFWLCACDAPSEVGSLYFHSSLAPHLAAMSCDHAPAMRGFLASVGIDAELCFMRSLGYMLAKWLILRDLRVGLLSLTPAAASLDRLGFSYTHEACGLWVLKGYAPVLSMKPSTRRDGDGNGSPPPVLDAKGSVLKYALAHQQLEAVVQLAHSVVVYDSYILVKARVDNLRIHVVKLGLGGKEDGDYADERHFPSRMRIRVGPEVGSTYVAGLTLTRSTENAEREVATQKVVKGSFGKTKVPNVKATARTATRTRLRSWRWDQDAEGNVAVLDGALCDGTSGVEVATLMASGGGGGGWDDKPGNGLSRRHAGPNRPFTKTGSVVFAGDEYGQEVMWRLSRKVEGCVLKWRIGAQIWVSYWPNNVKSRFYETRFVEWSDEVSLHVNVLKPV